MFFFVSAPFFWKFKNTSSLNKSTVGFEDSLKCHINPQIMRYMYIVKGISSFLWICTINLSNQHAKSLWEIGTEVGILFKKITVTLQVGLWLVKSCHSLVGYFYTLNGYSAGLWGFFLDKIRILLVKYCFVQMFLLDTFISSTVHEYVILHVTTYSKLVS